LTKFLQELVRRNIEGILLKDTADDDHGMGPHYVNHRFATKVPEMIGANDGVFVPTPHIIHTRLELNDSVEMRLIFHGPVHTTTNATERISCGGAAASQLLKRGDHAIRVETAIRKVDVGVSAKLQLSALLGSRRVDAYVSQSLEVVLTLIRINNVNRLMATLESIFYEWEQDPILFVGAIEESADMTRLVELGTGKRNGSRDLLHAISPTRSRAAPQLSPVELRMHHSAPKCPTHTLVLIDTFVQ
jgi:hypothetical protein